jgi:rhodanese-related sulfurtransferase
VNGFAQPPVNNTMYKIILKSMLSHTVPELSVKEADSLSQKGRIVFVDSREKNEYAVSHIKGSYYVGYKHFDMASLMKLPKNQKIVVYCSVGYRSEKIAEQLLKHGFLNVSNLYGGLFEWVNEDKPVVDSNNAPTQKVHAYAPSWGIWLKKGVKVYD